MDRNVNEERCLGCAFIYINEICPDPGHTDSRLPFSQMNSLHLPMNALHKYCLPGNPNTRHCVIFFGRALSNHQLRNVDFFSNMWSYNAPMSFEKLNMTQALLDSKHDMGLIQWKRWLCWVSEASGLKSFSSSCWLDISFSYLSSSWLLGLVCAPLMALNWPFDQPLTSVITINLNQSANMQHLHMKNGIFHVRIVPE